MKEPLEAYTDVQAINSLKSRVVEMLCETSSNLTLSPDMVTHEDIEIVLDAIDNAFYESLKDANEMIEQYEREDSFVARQDIKSTWEAGR